MKRAMFRFILALGIIVALVVLVRTRQKPEQQQPPVLPPPPAAPINTPTSTNAPTVATLPVPPPAPAEQLPVGWQDFRALTEHQQLNRVTTAMENHALPADLLAFFEKEIFNRKHMDVTRNNMANALVWQEQPNPQLHVLFIKMLEDETESTVWRDYCLQFLSECLPSSADPDAIKATLARYSKGKDGLAGTAIVHIGGGGVRPRKEKNGIDC